MLRRLAYAVGFGGLLAWSLAAPAFASPTSCTLTWTAPGDDGTSGTAAQYDVRLSTSPIDDANFANATRLTSAPVPLAAGATQNFLVTGLAPGTQYWFAIKTADERANWSGISNVVTFTTAASNDSVRPASPVIAINASTDNSVTLGWNATGDDSLSGTATRYEVRWSTATITEGNWASATLVSTGVPAPAAPGTAQTVTIGALDRTRDLFFAIRVADEVDQWSALSNVVRADHLLDTAPPAAPSGLSATHDAGGVHLQWTANSEVDLAGYHVYRGLTASGPFTRIDPTVLPTNSFLDATPPDSVSVWYQVSAVDASANESSHSATYRVFLVGAGISAFTLEPAYPNPSGLSEPVTFPVQVPATGPFEGRLDIVNDAGERVRVIALSGLVPGTTSVTWDGRNDAGRSCAPGVYRAWLSVGSARQQVKLLRR